MNYFFDAQLYSLHIRILDHVCSLSVFLCTLNIKSLYLYMYMCSYCALLLPDTHFVKNVMFASVSVCWSVLIIIIIIIIIIKEDY